MIKIFIGSSLQHLFRILRTELKEALQNHEISVIMWEKSRPAGITVSEGELHMIKESDICVFLLGSEFSQGTLDEYNFAKKNKKGIMLVDMTTIEGKTNEDMDSNLKENIWEVERGEKRITISWTSSKNVARQIKNGIMTRFPEITQIPDSKLLDLNNIQNSMIEELKRIEIIGVGRIIGVASPLEYQEGFFDFGEPTSFFRLLYKKGSGCLPSHGGNSEYGPNQLVYVDSNKRGRIIASKEKRDIFRHFLGRRNFIWIFIGI